jgi:hypothetical protein
MQSQERTRRTVRSIAVVAIARFHCNASMLRVREIRVSEDKGEAMRADNRALSIDLQIWLSRLGGLAGEW